MGLFGSTKKHKLKLTQYKELNKHSHGVESITRYYYVKCSCGWRRRVLEGRTSEDSIHAHVRQHKIDVLLKAAGITFSDTPSTWDSSKIATEKRPDLWEDEP